MSAPRLTKEQRSAILLDYIKGVPVKKLAAQYGCHHSYPSLLARRRGKPTRSGKFNMRYDKERDDGV